MATLPDLLDRRLRAEPGQPLITFYDDASGERTELSVQTYANWVSKTANLFADELMLDPGSAIRVTLPPHWLSTVFLGAAWACGVRIAGDDEPADLAVVGPHGLEDGLASGAPTVLACSLLPFAVRFPAHDSGHDSGPLPGGVLDYGLLWPGQADVFVPVEPTDLSTALPAVEAVDERLLTDLDPLGPRGARLLAGVLAGRGSLVLVAHPDEDRWPARYESERATGTVRTDQPGQPISR